MQGGGQAHRPHHRTEQGYRQIAEPRLASSRFRRTISNGRINDLRVGRHGSASLTHGDELLDSVACCNGTREATTLSWRVSFYRAMPHMRPDLLSVCIAWAPRS